MDNFFQSCPAKMEDGRLFTDYRSSQVREMEFKVQNGYVSENQTRTARIEHADKILHDQWNYLKQTVYCDTRPQCFHFSPTTLSTNQQNYEEIRNYNTKNPVKKCVNWCDNYQAIQQPCDRSN